MGADEIYRCLVENADFVVYQIDAQGLISYVSPSIEIYSGYKVEEFIGQSFTRFIHPEDISEVMVRFRDAAAGISGFSEFRANTQKRFCALDTCIQPASGRRASFWRDRDHDGYY